ncbi:MAG: DNA primase [Pseudomonadota bacterium]
MFSKSILNEIRDRISIVAFIGERVPLKRAGKTFKGACPFHNEKTPSFNVSDDKGIYHCFGCGEGGDIFQFVMKFDGMGFAEAVKYLAGRAGVELPRMEDPAARAAEDESARHKRWCLRVNEIARDYFVERFLDERAGARAREYLQARGIQREFCTQLFLGYADNSWDQLVGHLREKNAPLEIAAELGLIKRRDGGGYYDFFRDRIMFPIMSPRGEVLGFSGRDAGQGGDTAKYINSPDSTVYHKSNCVFGLDRAHGAIRNEDRVLLVEGNLDLVSLHQAGITNVVAPLGTALTAGHLRLLARYTRNMTVVFDGDSAGERAALRALEIFVAEELAPRVVPLPEGEDPDSLVRKEGADAFRTRIGNAPSLFEHFVERTLADTGRDASGKIAAMEKIIPIFKAVADEAQRGVYGAYLARRLDIDLGTIEKAAASGKSNLPAKVAVHSGAQAVAPQTDAAFSAERMLVETLVRRPELAQGVFSEIGSAAFEDGWCRTVAELLEAQFKSEGAVKVGGLVEALGDAELASQLRHMSLSPEKCGDDEVEELVRDCVARIKMRPISQRIEKINEDIRSAEIAGEEERMFALLTEKKTLARQVHGR